MPLILLGGITDLDAIRTAMNEGFEYVAMARALLREPDLLLRLQRDASTRSLCNHCNRCLPTIYTGTHCPLATIAPTVVPPSSLWGTSGDVRRRFRTRT